MHIEMPKLNKGDVVLVRMTVAQDLNADDEYLLVRNVDGMGMTHQIYYSGIPAAVASVESRAIVAGDEVVWPRDAHDAKNLGRVIALDGEFAWIRVKTIGEERALRVSVPISELERA